MNISIENTNNPYILVGIERNIEEDKFYLHMHENKKSIISEYNLMKELKNYVDILYNEATNKYFSIDKERYKIKD